MKNLLIILVLFIFSSGAWALRPIEGIILGDLKEDIQFDPLENVFDSRYKSLDQSEHNILYRELILEYLGFYREGENLSNSCTNLTDSIVYPTANKKDQAIQSLMASTQYIMLDLLTRAIGQYAKVLNFDKQEYINLVDNITDNYCSKNISTYSIKLLKTNLLTKFFEPNNFVLPDHSENPYFPENLKGKLASPITRKRELAYIVKSFRSMCSWNGMADEPRIMLPYLQNSFIMSFIIKQITNKKLIWDETDQALKSIESKDTVQVLCQNSICRKTDKQNFNKNYPRMVGTSSIESDLKRLYCFHFKPMEINFNDRSLNVRDWIEKTTFEDVKLELISVMSLLTGFQDLIFANDNFESLAKDAMEGINKKWTNWAVESTSEFSKDLLYEDQVSVDLISKPTYDTAVRRGEFEINFEVSMGEIDKSFQVFDKLKISFDLLMPRSLLHWARQKWVEIEATRDQEKKEAFIEIIVHHLQDQIQLQKDQFLVAPWSKGLIYVIAEELLKQILNYNGQNFKNFSNQMEVIPVRFHYGLFALKYFKYQFYRKYR